MGKRFDCFVCLVMGTIVGMIGMAAAHERSILLVHMAVIMLVFAVAIYKLLSDPV